MKTAVPDRIDNGAPQVVAGSAIFCELGTAPRSTNQAKAVFEGTRVVPDWAKGTALEGPHDSDTFACRVFTASPPTPDLRRPDVRFERKMHGSGKYKLKNGRTVTMWGYEDRMTGARPFPSPAIRVKVGQVVHTFLEASTGPHTVHHHGIEPLPFNDGVGHTSFEAGKYTYQWIPSHAGTFFYHCHRNTVLHFEMGMYGALIVDPKEGPGYHPSGARYDIERYWACDEIDPYWHDQASHSLFLCGGAGFLHDFKPTDFCISGVPETQTATNQAVSIKAPFGKKVLIRNVCAGYTVQETIFPFDVRIIAQDGHTLDGGRYTTGFTLPKNTSLRQTSAQRSDIYFETSNVPKGKHTVVINHRHWITDKVLGTQKATVEITG